MAAPAVEEKVYDPNYKRAVQIIVYDLQGGPFPQKAINEIQLAVQKISEAFKGLAITVVEE